MEVIELRKEAAKTANGSRLVELSIHPDMGVRRNVAMNIHTPRDVLVNLSEDMVFNVSYQASKRLNVSIIKNKEDHNHKCVICTIHGDDYSKCNQC
jgi:hypothetical protein